MKKIKNQKLWGIALLLCSTAMAALLLVFALMPELTFFEGLALLALGCPLVASVALNGVEILRK